MVPMERKHFWMFAVEIAILFHGILLKNSICESSATNETCRQKNVLLVSKEQNDKTNYFPTKAVYSDVNKTKLLFDIYKNSTDCHMSHFDCGYEVHHISNKDYLFLNNETLSKQDIVLMKEPSQDDTTCWPSELYSKGFLINIHFCLEKGVKNYRITQEDLNRGGPYNEDACKVSADKGYQCIITDRTGCISCNPPEHKSTTTPTTVSITTNPKRTGTTTSLRSTVTTISLRSTVTTISPESTDTTTSLRSTVTTISPESTDTTISPKSTDTTTSLRSTDTTISPESTDTTISPESTDTTTSLRSTVATTSLRSTVATTSPESTGTTISPESTDTTTSLRSTVTTISPESTGTTTSLRSTVATTSLRSTVATTSLRSTDTTISPESTDTTTSLRSTVATTSLRSTDTTTNPGSTTTDTRTSLQIAVYIMNNLSSMLGNLNTKHVSVGDVKGVITRLPLNNHTDINVAIKSGEFTIYKQMIDLSKRISQLSHSVHIYKDASAMAVKKNSSSAGVLLVPEIYPKGDPNSSFAGNMAVGIEMGAEISGLSPAVDIQFRNVEKNGKIASCRSWDGKGSEVNWITDGCQTNETSEGITCHCSHLTFFAILLSPPAKNISASDFKSLTYITSVGCGLSMFFLAVGLFMHFLIRKGKASRSTVILINLFVAMFNLNLSFLVNELIANLGNFAACVAIAAVMHYTMLATFSWFFIQALHLYFNLRTLHTDSKRYMTRICVAGWVTPAAVVIGLLAAGKYDYLFIYTDDGNSEKMCWISDAVVHQGVNIGYYAIVFIFTFTIFVMTVRHIVGSKPAAEQARNASSIKSNSFSILGLFLLLGITWAFAFFSYGPMLTPSYYIFTILNSFQGFFLFIYYYKSSKVIQEAGSISSSSITTSKTSVVYPQ